MRAFWKETGEPIDEATLAREGVLYRRLPPQPERYQPELDRLKAERGYVTQDVVELTPQTPGLEELLAKFDGEHRHDDDEARFVLDGEGTFDVRSRDDRWMRIVVQAGDLIVVPRGRYHRFELTEARRIRCVRLFSDPQGWVAHYRPSADASPVSQPSQP